MLLETSSCHRFKLYCVCFYKWNQKQILSCLFLEAGLDAWFHRIKLCFTITYRFSTMPLYICMKLTGQNCGCWYPCSVSFQAIGSHGFCFARERILSSSAISLLRSDKKSECFPCWLKNPSASLEFINSLAPGGCGNNFKISRLMLPMD